MVFEYVLATFSFDREADADANDPVNTDGDRRELPLTSFFTANLPYWVEKARVGIIMYQFCSQDVINIMVLVLVLV
jgi:hypothetical protein